MQGIDDATDDAFGTDLLDVRGDGEGGFEVLADGKNDGVTIGDRDVLKNGDVRAVGRDEELDLVFHGVGVHRVIVHADDFMSVAGELTGEVGAEGAEADDAEAHGMRGG